HTLAGGFHDTIGTGITLNEWNYFAIRYTGGKVDVYINSDWYSSDQWQDGYSLEDPGGSPLIVGAELTSKIFFKGGLDELSIFRTAISDDDIIINKYQSILRIKARISKEINNEWVPLQTAGEEIEGYGNLECLAELKIHKEIKSVSFYLSTEQPVLLNISEPKEEWISLSTQYGDRDYYSYVFDSYSFPDCDSYYLIVYVLDSEGGIYFDTYTLPFSINHYDEKDLFSCDYLQVQGRINHNSKIAVNPKERIESYINSVDILVRYNESNILKPKKWFLKNYNIINGNYKSGNIEDTFKRDGKALVFMGATVNNFPNPDYSKTEVNLLFPEPLNGQNLSISLKLRGPDGSSGEYEGNAGTVSLYVNDNLIIQDSSKRKYQQYPPPLSGGYYVWDTPILDFDNLIVNNVYSIKIIHVNSFLSNIGSKLILDYLYVEPIEKYSMVKEKINAEPIQYDFIQLNDQLLELDDLFDWFTKRNLSYGEYPVNFSVRFNLDYGPEFSDVNISYDLGPILLDYKKPDIILNTDPPYTLQGGGYIYNDTDNYVLTGEIISYDSDFDYYTLEYKYDIGFDSEPWIIYDTYSGSSPLPFEFSIFDLKDGIIHFRVVGWDLLGNCEILYICNNSDSDFYFIKDLDNHRDFILKEPDSDKLYTPDGNGMINLDFKIYPSDNDISKVKIRTDYENFEISKPFISGNSIYFS
ncbi:MAG: LamG-like jellyroll fold domain-containing protein, partial [Promethearchaeota archaeon]